MSRFEKFAAVLFVVLTVAEISNGRSEFKVPNDNQKFVIPDGDQDVHQPSAHCKPTTSNTDKLHYQFFPNSTKVGFAFVGVWLGFILIAKIMYTSSDQYRTTNKYDLVLFKPPNKASASLAIGPRRIYSNNTANVQNLSAAAASGIDFSVINVRSAALPNQSQQGQSHAESTAASTGSIVSQTNINVPKIAL